MRILKNVPIDLRPEHLAMVQKILHLHVPTAAVYAFGSRVNGAAKPMSDLDLAIALPEPMDLKTLAALQEAFEESTLPMKVDVVDLGKTSPEFKQIIERRKVIIQKHD